MTKEKSIVVRIDGKKLTKQRQGNLGEFEKISRREIAATEESSENRMHTYSREYDLSGTAVASNLQQHSRFHMFKPIIVAIISAITIGSILGFVMLKIIVNFDNTNTSPAILIPEDEDSPSNSNETSTPEGTKVYSIEPMTSFVLQGGIFSTAENAESESLKFVDKGYSPVIFEKDNQFFLLVSIGMTKEDLQEDINQLKDHGLDVYGKEWIVSGKEIKVSNEEFEWLSTFQDYWNTSLGTGEIKREEWQSYLASVPKQSEVLSSFASNLSDSLQKNNQKEVSHILLAMLANYNEFLASQN